MKTYWKLAKPDGWDFYTGKTINYRENIGKRVVCPNYNKKGKLCSDAFIHASDTPEKCFVGAKVPCSVYEVQGRPIITDYEKCGFRSLKIIKEHKPEDIFKWRYSEAVNPIHPFRITPPEITEEHIELVRQWFAVRDSARDSARASVGDSVWASVGASVGDSVGASAWYSAWYSVWASVRASVGDSVWASARDSARASAWYSAWYSAWDSAWDVMWAYMGYIFRPIIPKWKDEYPYQPAVDLWKQGLVPSFDGKVWRLHGGKDAEILWEGEK